MGEKSKPPCSAYKLDFLGLHLTTPLSLHMSEIVIIAGLDNDTYKALALTLLNISIDELERKCSGKNNHNENELSLHLSFAMFPYETS